MVDLVSVLQRSLEHAASSRGKAAGKGHRARPAQAREKGGLAERPEPMALREYRKKRDFKVTREPKPVRKSSKGAPLFVIQKHAASQLHYDFRLEWGGTLRSWAVPKGPPYAHEEKRLAMQVEDHPLDYARFEGIIPQGEYGGGTVMVWDIGTWEPLADDPGRGPGRGKDSLPAAREEAQGRVAARAHARAPAGGPGERMAARPLRRGHEAGLARSATTNRS